MADKNRSKINIKRPYFEGFLGENEYFEIFWISNALSIRNPDRIFSGFQNISLLFLLPCSEILSGFPIVKNKIIDFAI